MYGNISKKFNNNIILLPLAYKKTPAFAEVLLLLFFLFLRKSGIQRCAVDDRFFVFYKVDRNILQ